MNVGILVVDGNVGTRMLLSQILAGIAAKVYTAANPEEARNRAAWSDLDVGIIDADLADAELFDLLRFLKSAHPRIQMFLSSATLPNKGLAAKALASGASGFLTQPISASQLTEALK